MVRTNAHSMPHTNVYMCIVSRGKGGGWLNQLIVFVVAQKCILPIGHGKNPLRTQWGDNNWCNYAQWSGSYNKVRRVRARELETFTSCRSDEHSIAWDTMSSHIYHTVWSQTKKKKHYSSEIDIPQNTLILRYKKGAR